ncbi:FAD-dependent oxidoreductase [Candidatus Pacearchaeota archaeon]|nr:FAD-dependent oxidoreductase [Candidatus Pacearchaeota archaeon]
MKRGLLILIILISVLLINFVSAITINCDVLVVGGSSSGVAAAIQSARLGAKTCLIEETDWLGGMYTAAGISAFDGPAQNSPYYNTKCSETFCASTGLFEEIEKKIHYKYSFPDTIYPYLNLSKGSVSMSAFEPTVARDVLNTLVDYEDNLKNNVFYKTNVSSVIKSGNTVIGVNAVNSSGSHTFYANVTIDATELGEIINMSGANYIVGREDYTQTAEPHALGGPNNTECSIGSSCLPDNKTQAFAFAIVIKNYSTNKSMAMPADYDASKYSTPATGVDYTWSDYIKYGYTPDGSFSGAARFNYTKKFINWPNNGSDFAYSQNLTQWTKESILLMSKTEREALLKKALNHTLGFLYFLKNNAALGFVNNASTWGSYNEFSTDAKYNFTLIPYYRESRRIKGLDTLKENDISQFELPGNVTGRGKHFNNSIAIGDYNIDVHAVKVDSSKNNSENNEKLGGIGIATYPFQIPYTSLIPETIDGLIAAEKSISATHIAAGATRLQPITTIIGQAAGAAAALSAKKKIQPRDLSVRELQKTLIVKGKDALFYFSDVTETYPVFREIQILALDNVSRGYGAQQNYTFKPSENVSRVESAVFLARALEINLSDVPNCGGETFKDVSCTYGGYNETEALYKLVGDGMVCMSNATGKYYCPSHNITRAIMTSFLVESKNIINNTNTTATFSDVPINHKYYGQIEAAFLDGIVKGYGGGIFKPEENISRGEANLMIYRAFSRFNTAPMHSTPVLNSTNPATNDTNQNLTCYNQSSDDLDESNNKLSNVYKWYKNDLSTTVLLLPFDVDARDYSGNGNHGTVNGAVFRKIGGKIGGAYSFTGTNSYIQIADNQSLGVVNNFTIEMWLYDKNASVNRMLEKGDSYFILDDIAGASGCTATGRWQFLVKKNNVVYCVEDTAAHGQDIWYHVVGVKNDTHISIYVNGVLKASTAVSGNIDDDNLPMVIGSNDADKYFNGTIDEVRIYNKTLSAEQIRANYNLEYNKIVAQETTSGENWKCQVIPTDGFSDGEALNSSSLTIS